MFTFPVKIRIENKNMNKKENLPQVAVGAVVFSENKILLVKRSNHPAKGMWAVPGGKIQAGETMQQALVREIKEETGLDIRVGEIVFVFDVIRHDEQKELSFHYVIIDFFCDLLGGELKAGDDAREVRWISREDLKTIHVNEKTLTLLKEKYNFY